MSGQLTPNAVAARLAELSREVEDAVARLDKADVDAVNKRESYTLAYATAFLAADGAMEARKHAALQQTTEERMAAETADQIVRGLKRQIATLGLRIEVGRSIGSALKAELAALGGAP